MSGILIGSFLLLVALVAVLFVHWSSEFGGTPSQAQKQVYARSGHYRDGKFVNLVPTPMDQSIGKVVPLLFRYLFTSVPNQEPNAPPPIVKIDSLDIANQDPNLARLTWFGHSACLLEMEGKKILLDPMLSLTLGPQPALTSPRYNQELPIEPEKIPPIDAVLISHDHYDHLDYRSIVKLKDKVAHFYVPLGIGAHLLSWGVKPSQISELNWWDKVRLDGLTLICTPSRHFSGRGVSNTFTTLWSSWVIQSKNKRVYFSGDSGYGPHFKEIGRTYGPFDLALMECGQYNEQWANIHMMPEQTVQAAIDIKGKLLMPIHWAAFTEAMHSWTDPIERVTKKATQLNVPITTPKIGEPVLFNQSLVPDSRWWK